MASRFPVVGSVLLFVSIGCTPQAYGMSICSQDTSSDSLGAVEGGHGSSGDNDVAAVSLLQKSALQQRNQKQTNPKTQIAVEKVNATKDAAGHLPQSVTSVALSAADGAHEAAGSVKAAPEALLMEQLGKHFHEQIQAELTLDTTVMKDKLLLCVLELLAITSILGVDRCYMGQACLGAVKGLTCGGLGIWAFIDWFVVIINCLGSWESIHAFGFNANFYPNTVQPAYILSLVGMILYLAKLLCGCGYYTKKEMDQPATESKGDVAEEGEGEGKPVEEAAAAPQAAQET